jgi:hypothetical protein
MLSAVIRNGHSYRAVPLAGQLVHHRSAHPGPLVLGATPLNSPARTLDRDRTVSQRSEPSSRTALMGEQPNPWEVLPPQDATSRHRAISAVTGGADYLSTVLFRATGRRLIAATESPPRRQTAISPLSSRADQSLQGHVSELIARSTDFPRCCPRSHSRSCGVHRYKPVREWRFRHLTPNVEVPNDAVAVNAWAS